MINSVRNTVLAIINKNNYGYISPSDFNLFAKQAQLDIFDEYFILYNQQVNEENARVSGSDYADIKKGYEEVIDTFSVNAFLTQNNNNVYYLPSTTTTGNDYYLLNNVYCYNGGIFQGEAEKVNNNKIKMILNSILTSPSTNFPVYTQQGDSITIYPNTFSNANDVEAQYIRYPKDPKWTYVSLYNGEPLFDQTQSDYQDFELPIDDSNNLVAKILQYAGLSIREADVVQFGLLEEQEQNQNNT
ncbi:MAG: hypothetical protein CBC96_01055 [Pelagibacteraceae bacterium TMED136]|jgi:hypothetical protein|nr:MAG: hypothetical protein CBC96_01055 [Pelagibacteraceae bacterium TMED136]|tara:strand:+ start:28 stop:759 length:732 start_codon:yes stop_codon:yes gene_type:complete